MRNRYSCTCGLDVFRIQDVVQGNDFDELAFHHLSAQVKKQ